MSQKRPIDMDGQDIGVQKTSDILSSLMRSRKRSKMTQTETPGSQTSGSDSGSGSQSESESSESESESDTDEDSDNEQLPAQAGVIEKITLKNFMCHDSFELELGPRLNFIIGRNGSGKSAIITGISVGLGAKASDTSRGSAITDLIKDGKSTARIIITFKNNGVDGFYPDKYGDRITIERRLSREGGSSNYTIKDSTGKTFSTKKSDIDEILLKYNIRVDNPLSFLSQDKAREFLTATSDEAKFQYFMQGVLVTDIINNHKQTSNHVSEIKGKLSLAKENQVIAREKLAESIKQHNRFKESDELRRKVDLLQGKIFWYNVYRIELGIKKYEDIIAAGEAELQAIDKTREHNKEKSRALTTKIQDSKTEIETLKDRLVNIVADIASTTKSHEDLKRKKDDLEQEIKRNKDSIDTNTVKIQGFEQEIVAEQMKIDQINGGSFEELNHKKNQLYEQIKQLKDDKDDKNRQLEELNGEGVMQQLRAKITEERELANAISDDKDRIRTLNESKRDRYIAWGSTMKRLVQHIDSINSWHQKPLGPIGSLINVKKDYTNWKSLLNTVLSRTLDSFLVSDEHDRKMLLELLKKYNVSNGIIVRKFETFDFHGGKPEDEHITFVDMMNFHNEFVLYTLIDFNSIEKSIITNDQRLANKLVSARNVQNVYSLTSGTTGQRSYGDVNSFSVDPVFFNTRQGMKLSSGTSMDGIDEEMRQLERSIHDKQRDQGQLAADIRQFKIEQEEKKAQIRNQINGITKTINQLTNEVTEIEQGLDEGTVSAKIDSLRARIDDLNQQNTRCSNILISIGEDMSNMDTIKETKAIRHKLKQLQLTEREILGQTESLEQEVESMMDELTVMDGEDNRNVIKEAQIHETIQKRKEKIVVSQQKKEEFQTRGETFCQREDVPITEADSSETVEQEFRIAQKALEEADKLTGMRYEDIQQELLHNNQLCEQIDEQVNNLQQLFDGLQADLLQRLSFLRRTISINIQEAKTSFENALDVRKYKGKLIVDNQNQKVTMLVAPQEASQVRSVDSLSGGEKSFTQIAFLLSIWKIMNSKIRGLDEFDVFMDSMNRTASINLLLNELKKVPQSQTILITPQDITTIASINDDVRIHRMSNPRGD
ncbi:structural maintenance of chromosomes protein 6 [[Candida] jaroonii]|uniref:Structural maintenance of chromosomes protein 6 n=1 Tax=[Candida] jaroonii TaxID=467808 RepID=A0ACA9YFL3_9ASCO|nr:structural maintenance of chromosomes protein 6 [[Candida] jaroonii]